jgi:hypothetical protein
MKFRQAESNNAYLRGLSSVFSPSNKKSGAGGNFPEECGDECRLGLNWARLPGSRLALLPYESTGHLAAGEKLLAAVDAAPGQTSKHHMKVADA